MGSYRLEFWVGQFRHWYRMLANTSYYHQPQGLGKAFLAGQLQGYFNDMTAKAAWTGKVDEEGIAYHILSNGQRCYFPISLAQKALGHWDLWLQDSGPSRSASRLYPLKSKTPAPRVW